MENRHDRGARRAATALAVVVWLALGACAGPVLPTGTDRQGQPPSLTPTPPPPVPGSAGSCTPGSPRTSRPGGIEVEGVLESGHPVWALFATDAIQPVTALTVWWHVAGNGGFHITLVGPQGRLVTPLTPRPGTTGGWDRPGEPWVGKITFPETGCWRVAFVRGSDRGDLWVVVT